MSGVPKEHPFELLVRICREGKDKRFGVPYRSLSRAIGVFRRMSFGLYTYHRALPHCKMRRNVRGGRTYLPR